MRIVGVVPWPSAELWCYEGTWIEPDETINLPNGDTIILAGRSFHGYCFVSEMTLQSQEDENR